MVFSLDQVLHFISLILQHIPTKKSTFVSLGLHRLLLLKPAVSELIFYFSYIDKSNPFLGDTSGFKP
jgi:hypothetical protein